MWFWQRFVASLRRSAPATFRIKVNGETTEVTDGQILQHGIWYVGRFAYDKHCGGWIADLGMETQVVRDSRACHVGWNGLEHHIGTRCVIQPGDVLRYARVFDLHPAWFPDMTILQAA